MLLRRFFGSGEVDTVNSCVRTDHIRDLIPRLNCTIMAIASCRLFNGFEILEIKIMEEIIKRMQTRIMEHQKENGFETIFDFLNEDLSELEQQLKNLNIPVVSGSAWDLPDGVYKVGVDRAKPDSKDKSCRIWMKQGINGEFRVVAVEHYR